VTPSANVKELVDRLRGILGHLGTRDRALVVEAVEGLTDVSLQLFHAEQALRHARRALEGPTVDGPPTPEGKAHASPE
jgi:hypothetical protein